MTLFDIESEMESIEDDGYVMIRDYPTGMRAAVVPLITGTGRLIVGTVQEWQSGYDEAFCYDSVGEAVIALLNWNGIGEPDGWFRNPGTGRRRPKGEVTKEYVWP
jgi:hypothetical protein